MENREPYQIRGLMLAYNLFQTVFSFWMFLEGWGFYMTGEYNWVCQPVDYSDSPGGRRALNLAWWYFFSKARTQQSNLDTGRSDHSCSLLVY